ncbi:hypothetical protein ABGB18_13805 [Nonomuraea sp. B12E4]|uniref:hypothetical protein n=1 Tax=Nonomuraea sp. B12E4 TaxID=3153564 RepID=UPI00325CC3E9
MPYAGGELGLPAPHQLGDHGLGAGGAVTDVRMSFEPDLCELTVTNPFDRPGANSGRGGGGGYGVVGMRERAALLNGTLEAGERCGQFRVRLSLPAGIR